MNFCIAKPVLDYDTLAKGLKLDDNLVDWMVSRVNFWLILVLVLLCAFGAKLSYVFHCVTIYTQVQTFLKISLPSFFMIIVSVNGYFI